jgi:sugar-specific transcriptional regulator TrmB
MNKLQEQLKRLGFTHQEIQVYLTLIRKDACNAKQIAKKLAIFPNAVYRTIHELAKKGFVTTTKRYPITFEAVSPQTAIPLFVEGQMAKLQDISTTITTSLLPLPMNSNPTTVDLMYGTNTIFEHGAKLLDASAQEMLVISIGEPLPPNLLLAVKNAVARGVSINMIVHKYDEENKAVIENLKKNGYIIRYSPGWGFHIAIYDQKNALLIVNNPEQTDERVAMFIRSVGLCKALRDYFYTTWRKAKVV